MANLTCPKCGGAWQSFERSGITVDHCTGCRGVFLDRGEPERLVDAEGSFYEERGASREEPVRQEHDVHQERDFRQERGGHRKPYKKRKKQSFLSDFLDF